MVNTPFAWRLPAESQMKRGKNASAQRRFGKFEAGVTPAPGSLSGRLGLDPIADRPRAAAALANAIAAWNLFEWDLAVTYSIAMGFYLPGYKGWEPPNHPMAFDIMDTIAGLGSRLDLIHVALERVAPDLA